MTRKFLAAVALVAAIGGVAAPAVANARPYKNCSEARANGDTNIPASSDKYGSHLDRDGDGIACES
jgi:hypothetical protein